MKTLLPNQHCRLVGRQWENSAGQLHRVDESGIQDGPALIYPDGSKVWGIWGTDLGGWMTRG